MDNHTRELIIGLTCSGLILNVLLLVAFAYTAWNPVSRVFLNRVSFRLLIYAIIANLVFEATSFPGVNDPGLGCAASAFLSASALLFSSCMFCCMAINLQLVLIHGMNGIFMEKYYILFSLLLTFSCTLATLGSGHFGFSTLNNTCWFTASSPNEQIRWLIGAQWAWILCMAFTEVVLFLVLVWYILRQQRASITHCTADPTYLATSRMETTIAPIVQYRVIILRIGLYPILSCTLNCFGIILDLYLIRKPAGLETIRGLDLLSLCIYSLRPLFYGFLAATDPAFLRALRGALCSPTPDPTFQEEKSTSSRPPSSLFQPQQIKTKRFSATTQALVHVDLGFEKFVDGASVPVSFRLGTETETESSDSGGSMRRPSVCTVGDLPELGEVVEMCRTADLREQLDLDVPPPSDAEVGLPCDVQIELSATDESRRGSYISEFEQQISFDICTLLGMYFYSKNTKLNVCQNQSMYSRRLDKYYNEYVKDVRDDMIRVQDVQSRLLFRIA
ncbi:hypothetical protein FB45DRAFT_1019084 [Roridomyces roridus]|uniref:Uncharacterized protein n=1 Tax=Roridomyces roridus TaxID=1738132 RepID=A0AAD7FWB1_9AGAR|nr:hypothetical protein FB45DRAFT_1019084 [Roridomyces roridus]